MSMEKAPALQEGPAEAKGSKTGWGGHEKGHHHLATEGPGLEPQ